MRGCLRQCLVAAFILASAFAQQPDTSAPSTSAPPGSESPPLSLELDASGAVPQSQMRALLLRVAENDLQNFRQERDYTYIRRQEERRLDSHGRVEKKESQTSEIFQLYGEQVGRLIKKDDMPLTDAEASNEEAKIQKLIDRRRQESEDDRRKRLEKEEKDQEEDRKFVLEVADAFNFRLAGSELLHGRDTWVLDAEPRPGYQPQRREAKMLSKFQGRIWIDKDELQWVKVDLTAIENLSFGWIVARIQKGTHIHVEQIRVNEEVWLPQYVQFHVDARIALLKSLRMDVEQTYQDYKKFRTDTKVTVIGNAGEQ